MNKADLIKEVSQVVKTKKDAHAAVNCVLSSITEALGEGGSVSLIGVFIILYRFITYHMNLIAGAIFMQRIFKSVASFSMDILNKDEDTSEFT